MNEQARERTEKLRLTSGFHLEAPSAELILF
jgi:hypothetical protein